VREHVAGIGGVADSRVLEHWRVVDTVPLNANREKTHVGRDGVNAPGNCNQLGLAGHSRAGTARGQDGISHATVAAVEDDVFNDADFFALRGLYFCADDFARLHVTRATRTGRGLGLCIKWSRCQTQDGQRRSA